MKGVLMARKAGTDTLRCVNQYLFSLGFTWDLFEIVFYIA
jgi:hypothetical protein